MSNVFEDLRRGKIRRGEILLPKQKQTKEIISKIEIYGTKPKPKPVKIDIPFKKIGKNIGKGLLAFGKYAHEQELSEAKRRGRKPYTF